LWDFTDIQKELEKIEIDSDHKGFGIFRLFLALLLQFTEDLNDRELERYLSDTNSAKWFCQFGLVEKTPNFRDFTNTRKRIGTNRLSKIFNILKDQLRQKGCMGEVFTFINASHLISKATLWKERDRAIKEKYDKLNNEILPKFARDKEANFGCKGGNKFWYGFKKHTRIDMQSGMINKVAITKASLIDSKGMKHVTPKTVAVFGSNSFYEFPKTEFAQSTLKSRKSTTDESGIDFKFTGKVFVGGGKNRKLQQKAIEQNWMIRYQQ
jgi:IS5 family transposase